MQSPQPLPASAGQGLWMRGEVESPYDPRLSDPHPRPGSRPDPAAPPLSHRPDRCLVALLAPLIPAATPAGDRPPIHDRRELVNAMAF